MWARLVAGGVLGVVGLYVAIDLTSHALLPGSEPDVAPITLPAPLAPRSDVGPSPSPVEPAPGRPTRAQLVPDTSRPSTVSVTDTTAGSVTTVPPPPAEENPVEPTPPPPPPATAAPAPVPIAPAPPQPPPTSPRTDPPTTDPPRPVEGDDDDEDDEDDEDDD